MVNFLVREGDSVNADQDLIEVETNKATMHVTSPCSGRLSRFTVNLSESYPVGAVLGYLEATAEVIARVASEGFGLLDAPPQRLNAKDTPVPYHPNLWAAHRPTARSITAAARQLLQL